MNGVEILSSAQVASEFAFNWTWFWIGFGIIFGMCVIISIYHIVKDDVKISFSIFVLLLGIIGGLICGAQIGYVGKTPTAYETHYKVTIDDSVSLTEFLDKYEILDQEGKIYTVKERE